MNYEFDDIDRALFALPLEEPPPGLRDAILSATQRAAHLAPSPVQPWEFGFIGVCAAFTVWLTYGWLTDPGIARQLTGAFVSFGRSLSDPASLAWLAVGLSVAATVSYGLSRPMTASWRRIRL